MDDRFIRFVDEIEEAASTHDLFSAFAAFNKDAGFYFSFFALKPLPLRARRTPPKQAFVAGSHDWVYQDFVPYTDGPQEIWDMFDRHKLYDVDPLVEHARHNARPIVLGIDCFGRNATTAPYERNYYEKLAPLGLCNSFCIPTVNSFERGFGGAGVHSNLRGEAFFALAKREFTRVVAATHIFDKAFHPLYRREYAARLKLSAREAEILQRLLAGFSNDELAHAFGISVPMVSVHLKAIRNALGVETNREIPTAALAFGLVGDL